MKKIKALLFAGGSGRIDLEELECDGFELHHYACLTGSIMPPECAAAIKLHKPDFCIFVNVARSIPVYNNFDWPKGPKYITWALDDYRHSETIENSDLHFTAIPSSAMKDKDIFLPVFSKKLSFKPFDKRKYSLGVIAHRAGVNVSYRGSKIQEVCNLNIPENYVQYREYSDSIDLKEYNETISHFKYGLNVAVYNDAFPNYRSFELGISGVLNVCPRPPKYNEDCLRELFEDYVVFYDDPKEVVDIVADHKYDADKMRRFFMEKHTFKQRLKIMFSYFGVNYPA